MTGSRFIVLIVVSSLLFSCSLFERKPEVDANSTMIRDVGYQARPTESLRKRIVVLPFLDEKPQRSTKVTDIARHTVVQELTRTGRFVIIKNEDLPQDPSKFLTENREYDLEKISMMAGSMGISAVIEGKIVEIKARRIGDEVGVFRKLKARVATTVRVRMVSTKNGRIVLDEVRKGEVETETTRVAEYSYSDRFLEEDPTLVRNSVRKAFYGSVRNLVMTTEKLSWEGRIAHIAGERLYVNAGRLSGIQIGDILKIMDEGEEVYDPDSGLFIGRAPGRMKGTLEVTTYFGKDGAQGIVHSGSGFKVNDLVELY